MTLLEDFPDFTLWHDPTCACLYATWVGKHAARRTQAKYRLIWRHVQATGSTKLLHDALLDEDGWAQVADWVATNGFQYLAKAGVHTVAWVLPHQSAAFCDTARVLAQLRQPLVETFLDAQAAYDWLHRWPRAAPTHLETKEVLSAAAFLLLPPAQQVALVTEQGRALVPRWETDYYVKRYELDNSLCVEVFYYLHSGTLYQVPECR